jgi:hypothetical protein
MAYELLTSVVLGSNGDSIDSGTFTAKKFIYAQIQANATGGNINCVLTFDSVTSGSKYTICEYIDGGSFFRNNSLNNTDNLTGTTAGGIMANVYITNTDGTYNKTFISDGIENTTGAGNSPNMKHIFGMFEQTSQITSIQAVNGSTGDYLAGASLSIFGADD